MHSIRWIALVGVCLCVAAPAQGQGDGAFVPVTDAMLSDPDPADWLSWRRTANGWGYSPLDQIDRDNVADLRLVWSRALAPGSQQGTPLVYDGVMYMPNPDDVIQAIDAATGDLLWEHRRSLPDDVREYVRINSTNRNIAIYDNLIINTTTDDYIFALDAATGREVWETRILDYKTHRPTRPPVRSSPTARSSRAAAACRRADRRRASSRPTTRAPAASCGART